MLHKVERLFKQQPQDSHKLYSLHAPEVECIAKGKVRQPYEFGVKVLVATTHKEGLVVGMQSLPGNPFDGHALHMALEQVKNLTQRQPKEVFVDLGYRGATIPAGVDKILITNIEKRDSLIYTFCGFTTSDDYIIEAMHEVAWLKIRAELTLDDVDANNLIGANTRIQQARLYAKPARERLAETMSKLRELQADYIYFSRTV